MLVFRFVVQGKEEDRGGGGGNEGRGREEVLWEIGDWILNMRGCMRLRVGRCGGFLLICSVHLLFGKSREEHSFLFWIDMPFYANPYHLSLKIS